MENQLISFDIAKLANKKGFNEWTEKRYDKKGTFNDSKTWNISAPTQSLLQKWLREIHNIDIDITRCYLRTHNDGVGYQYEVKTELIESVSDFGMYNTYEDALEKALESALKLI